MKTDDNGTIREMTAEEIAEHSAAAAHMPPEVQGDTRLDEIEAALMELAAIVGGGDNG